MKIDQNLLNTGPVAITCYCFSSIMMTVTNKYVLSGGFNMNSVLLAVQGFVCMMLVQTLRLLGFCNFRPMNKQDAKVWWPVTALLCAMIYTASKALQFLTIPLFTIFKNCTIICIAYAELIFANGKPVTGMTLVSFGLIVLSSIVAAWADQNAPKVEQPDTLINPGYFWMLTNCFTNAAFVVLMKRRISQCKFSDVETMYFNNTLSVPMLLIYSLLTETWTKENLQKNFPPGQELWVIFCMAVSGLLSAGISYCSGWCVRVVGSTTYSMVGALNKLPLALSGIVFFGTPATFGNLFAIFLGFVAGGVYALAKNQEKAAENNKATELPTTNK